MAETTFISDFRRNFVTGLAALFPILITIFLLSWLYARLDENINGAFKTVLVENPVLYGWVFPDAPPDLLKPPPPGATAQETTSFEDGRRAYADMHFPNVVGVLLGTLMALAAVYLIGFLLRGYFGARVVARVDRFFEQFPVIKSIYPHARQVADVMFGGHGKHKFRRAVAVQYPRRGIYTVGFLTGEGLKDVEDATGQDFMTVFIPTSPAPMTGFVVLVPRADIIELDMNVEETLKFTMTAGMVAGRNQRPWTLAGAADKEDDSLRLWRADAMATHANAAQEEPASGDGKGQSTGGEVPGTAGRL